MNETSTLRDLVSSTDRILLVNCHAIDIRLPWYRWHQPTGLLQLGTKLKNQGNDIRFIDCLGWDTNRRVRRRKVGELEIEGRSLDLWRFGGLLGHIDSQIWDYKREGWSPKKVLISCGQTSWWQGARDLIKRIKNQWYPNAEVVLGGVYPTLEPEHAKIHTDCDSLVVGSIEEVNNVIPDLTLYSEKRRPKFAGIFLYNSQSISDVRGNSSVVPRQPEQIAEEVVIKASLGVKEFAFFDEEILFDQRDHFIAVLREIASKNLDKVRFVAIGNLTPNLINNKVAHWMGQAGYKKVYLKYEVNRSPEKNSYETSYDTYRYCVKALISEAGFRSRQGDVTAMLLVGNPNEDMEAVTEQLIRLASIVGSVNLIQYQYSHGTLFGDSYTNLLVRRNGNLNLTELNCKLYPLARLTGNTFDNYLELTRLATLLNNKYRSRTFDFLGNSLIHKAVRTSFRTKGWNPIKD